MAMLTETAFEIMQRLGRDARGGSARGQFKEIICRRSANNRQELWYVDDGSYRGRKISWGDALRRIDKHLEA